MTIKSPMGQMAALTLRLFNQLGSIFKPEVESPEEDSLQAAIMAHARIQPKPVHQDKGNHTLTNGPPSKIRRSGSFNMCRWGAGHNPRDIIWHRFTLSLFKGLSRDQRNNLRSSYNGDCMITFDTPTASLRHAMYGFRHLFPGPRTPSNPYLCSPCSCIT
jgi:hypothetical protein